MINSLYNPAKDKVFPNQITRLSDVPINYTGRLDLTVNGQTFSASIDGAEGGKWVLIYQYFHRGGTNPALNEVGFGQNFPVDKNLTLGTDDSSDLTSWRHISLGAIQAFPDLTSNLELRFYGRSSSAGTKVTHFRTKQIIDKWRDNTGNILLVATDHTVLTGNVGLTPGGITNTSNYVNQNLWDFPFWGSGENWGIRGRGNRWEANTGARGFTDHTIHKIWVRSIL